MVKVNRTKLEAALAYRKKINDTPFEELDWSEYPEVKNVSEKEIEKFLSIGLNNIDFIGFILEV